MDFIQDASLLIKYIFLGLVQGFTEPIPISSSGHLVILREILNIKVHGLSFEILVNFGSLIAIVIVYRNDILRLTQNAIQYVLTRNRTAKADFKFIIYLFIATTITGIIGVFFEDYISTRLNSAIFVGFTLLITGAALWIIRKLQGEKSDHQLTIKDAIIVGFVQAIALIPGISRSGATIVATMLLGMKRETALRFSFLLFIPISIGITIFSVNDLVNDPNFSVLAIPYLLAFMTSIIATFYSLKWFMNIMEKGKLKYFSYYCVIVGFLVIIFL